ncbi:MAG: MFS transporter [Anaerolineales bacterium]
MRSLNDLEIRKNLRFNILVNLLDGGFFGLGIGFSSFTAFIPIFINRLTDSAILIGLIPSLHSAGWQFPQLFTAGWTSRLRRFKPTVLWLTIQERIPFIGLALVAWFLPALGKKNALIISFLLLAWQGLGGGFTANPWTSMISKIIPGEYRGTFFGSQSAAASGLSSIGSILAGIILIKISDRYDFSLLFLITGAILVISLIFLSLTREPEDTEVKIPEKRQPFWKGTRTILKRDRDFRWFLIGRIISQFSAMGFSFYIIYAINQLGLSDLTAGLVSATSTGIAILANPLMGWIGDKRGYKQLLLMGILAAATGSFLAWYAPSQQWFYLIMALTGIGTVALWTIPLILVVKFGKETERPIYIGLSNTLIAPAAIAAPLIGGWLAELTSYPIMFLLSGFMGIATFLIFLFFFTEPEEMMQ